MRVKHLISVLCILMISSCNSSVRNETIKKEEATDLENFNEQINSVLKNYSISAQVNTTVINQELYVDLFINSTPFGDDESQKLFLSLLLYEKYPLFIKNNKVHFKRYNDEIKGVYNSYNKQEVETFYKYYSNNSYFVSSIQYVFNNMSLGELLRINLLIKRLNENLPDLFTFNGSFYEFIEGFTKSTSDKDSIFFTEFVRFSKFISKDPTLEIPQRHFDEIFNICGLDIDLYIKK